MLSIMKYVYLVLFLLILPVTVGASGCGSSTIRRTTPAPVISP